MINKFKRYVGLVEHFQDVFGGIFHRIRAAAYKASRLVGDIRETYDIKIGKP